ncbi:polysaccharide pyruvyl transferase family protein [Corynebacterium halotolerans]|uniref:Polysaccharide pyruvyl transferase domain-containing protein n=1 Tax=Corynebacterium halotolerans YIM 70093 = DSM 44683 TaxID=1121362 RepID=M1NK07_9CORY|nr:polysaccharide pyruvyl transferase family protein [Corynebacterium halotolerans]AGF71748.1 hypothetical protein A605_03685 [Corynebacterium halotolerans YIM 70093 = DSM 44683]
MRRERELIYLVAPSGHPNFGDEFIASAWLRELARRRPRARVVLDCHTPGVAAVLHHRVHPDLTVTDTLWRLAERAETPDDAAAVVADPGRFPELVSGVHLAAHADVVHVLGGGWINDHWPHHTKVVAAAASVGRPQAVRAATGQGLTPATEVAADLAPWWARFDRVDVRDTPSLDVLPAGVDAAVSGDDAWLYAADTVVRHGLGQGTADARDRDFVLCAQSDLLGVPVEQLAQWLLDALRALGATGPRLAVVECIPRGDAVVWDHMRRLDPHLCAGAHFVAFDELWTHGLPARPGQTWVTTRYHPHLIAAARGARGIAVVAHEGPYYQVKHEAVGSSWPVVAVTGSSGTEVPAAGPGFTEGQLRERSELARAVADRIYPVGRLADVVRNTFEALRDKLWAQG